MFIACYLNDVKLLTIIVLESCLLLNVISMPTLYLVSNILVCMHG
jgi:hypothetical protein